MPPRAPTSARSRSAACRSSGRRKAIRRAGRSARAACSSRSSSPSAWARCCAAAARSPAGAYSSPPAPRASAAARADRPLVVGFAAETEAVEQNARTKLMKKNLDMIAANEVGHDKAFDCEDNQLIVLSRNGRHELGRAGKLTLARGLVGLIAEDLAARAGARTRGTARA